MNVHAAEAEVPAPRPGSARFTFSAGDRPLGGYTIKRGVGRGGFGDVFYAISDAGKEVALKLVRRNLDVELRGVTHCLNLKHPNLVAIYDVRQDDEDNTWIIMEYVSGQSLEDALEQHPQGMPAEMALEWLRGIAAGVGYLHDHGIVHRDLKPGNVFCDEGLVKLGDYGLSKFISCSRRSGHTESIGTVHYMAPEVANGRYGKEIDIYALGVMLYEMLTGHVPFEGESIGEVLMKHLTAEPNLQQLAEPFRTVVGRALAKDPAVRFSSVDGLLEMLPRSVGGPPPIERLGQVPPAPPNGMPSRPQVADAKLPPPLEDEDPVWRAICDTWNSLTRAWNNTDLSTPAKVGLLLVLLFGLATNIGTLSKVLILGVIAFGTYRVVRAITLHVETSRERLERARNRPAPYGAPAPGHVSGGPPVAGQGVQAHAAAIGAQARADAAAVRNLWARPPEQSIPALELQSPRQRLTSLLGSMAATSLVCAVVSGALLLARREPILPEQYAWLALTSMIGSWCVLIPAKLWEGTNGDPILRRVGMLIVGAIFGAAAYGLDQALLVTLPFEVDWPHRAFQGAGGFAAYDGSPLLSAYAGYFGCLFLLVRWWCQATPLRSARVGLWPTFCTIVAAWIPNFIWAFPQPWGLFVAATISITIQLCTPWRPVPPRPQRPQLR